jgi:hypothetical protein
MLKLQSRCMMRIASLKLDYTIDLGTTSGEQGALAGAKLDVRGR